MDDLFRSFFNIPRKRDFSGSEDFAELDGNQSSDMESIGSLFGAFFPRDIFKQMDEMMSSMENMMKSGDHDHFHSVVPGMESESGKKRSPREQMLKDEEQDSIPNLFQPHRMPGDLLGMEQQPHDSDLDKIVRNPAELDRILSNRSSVEENPERSRSKKEEESAEHRKSGGWKHWSTSFSSVTVRGADGSTEKKETRRDSDGNTESLTKRMMADGRSCTDRVVTDHHGRVIEASSDCAEDMLRRSRPSLRSDSGVDRSSLSTRIHSSPNSDDHTVFKNIFGPDLPKSDC